MTPLTVFYDSCWRHLSSLGYATTCSRPCISGFSSRAAAGADAEPLWPALLAVPIAYPMATPHGHTPWPHPMATPHGHAPWPRPMAPWPRPVWPQRRRTICSIGRRGRGAWGSRIWPALWGRGAARRRRPGPSQARRYLGGKCTSPQGSWHHASYVAEWMELMFSNSIPHPAAPVTREETRSKDNTVSSARRQVFDVQRNDSTHPRSGSLGVYITGPNYFCPNEVFAT